MSLATALPRSHRAVVRVDILEQGAVVASSTVELDQLLVANGRVSSVRRAEIRRTADLEFIDQAGSLVPLSQSDLLDPLARREIQVWRGVQDVDGSQDLASLAVVVLESADVSETDGAIQIRASGRDRSVLVSDNPWTAPYTIATGANIATAIQDIIVDRTSVALTYAFSPVSDTTSGRITYDTSTNPWAAAQKLAEGIGHELFFDADGVCTLRPVPNPATDPVAWEFVGDTNLRVSPMQRSINTRNLKNGVIVMGEAPWLLFPVRGEAWDTNLASPTYYDPANPTASRVGPRPEVIRDATVFSDAQAQTAAEAKLLDILGVDENLAWSSIPHPGLRVGDVVSVESDVVGGTVRGVIETLEIPLSVSDSMSATMRRRRTS